MLMQHSPGFTGRDFSTPVLTPLFAFLALQMITCPCFQPCGKPQITPSLRVLCGLGTSFGLRDLLGWLCVKLRFFSCQNKQRWKWDFLQQSASEDAPARGRVGWLLWFSGSFKCPDLAFASPLTEQHSLHPQSQDSITVPGME